MFFSLSLSLSLSLFLVSGVLSSAHAQTVVTLDILNSVKNGAEIEHSAGHEMTIFGINCYEVMDCCKESAEA